MKQTAKILVVDDERPVRMMLEAALRAQGYRVQVAESGEAQDAGGIPRHKHRVTVGDSPTPPLEAVLERHGVIRVNGSGTSDNLVINGKYPDQIRLDRIHDLHWTLPQALPSLATV